MGSEESGIHTIESDFSGSFGGRTERLGREIRFKGVAAREIDYSTAEGFQEGRQPRRPSSATRAGPSKRPCAPAASRSGSCCSPMAAST